MPVEGAAKRASSDVSGARWPVAPELTGGLGRQLTEQLLAHGDRVAVTLRHPEALDDLHASASDQLWVRRLDITDAAEAQAVLDAAFAELGTIDVVVNNAGYGVFAALEEASDDQIRRVGSVRRSLRRSRHSGSA